MNEIINIFREALLALIPLLEKANIPWQDSEQFEEFDEIAEALFNCFVVHKIENFITESYESIPNIPKYGFHYKDYSKMSFIEISPSDEPYYLVFNFLVTNENAFDTVSCNKVSAEGKLLEEGLLIDFNDATFRFLHRLPNGEFASFE